MVCLYAGESRAFRCQWLYLLAHWVDARDALLASLLIGRFLPMSPPSFDCSRRIGFLAPWRCDSSCKMAARWERATFDVCRRNDGAVAFSFECKMPVAVFSRWTVCQAAVRAAVRSSRYYGKVCRILCDVTDEDLTDMSYCDITENGSRIACLCLCIKW